MEGAVSDPDSFLSEFDDTDEDSNVEETETLLEAIEDEDLEECKRMDSKSFSSEIDDTDEDSSLHESEGLLLFVEEEQYLMCKFCIRDGADVNYSYTDTNTQIATPIIHTAVLTKNRKIIKLLVRNGADINKRVSPDGTHVLDHIVEGISGLAMFALQTAASFQRRIDFMNFLFSLGCKPHGNVLGLAVHSQRMNTHNKNFIKHGGNYDVCKWLIHHGCLLNGGSETRIDEIPIIAAGEALDPQLVRLLLYHGVDLDIRDVKASHYEDINPLECVIHSFLAYPSSQDDDVIISDKPESKEWRTTECIEKALQVVHLLIQGGTTVCDSTIVLCNDRLAEETGRKYPRERVFMYLNGLLGMLTSPLSLESQCRILIRRHVGKEKLCRLGELELPREVKNYLEYFA